MLAVFGGILFITLGALELGWILARLAIVLGFFAALGAVSFVLWAINELTKAF